MKFQVKKTKTKNKNKNLHGRMVQNIGVEMVFTKNSKGNK